MNQINDFFPTNDYKVPSTSNYLKLNEGEHTFRVLSSAVVGWQYFTSEKKPIKSREPFESMPVDIKPGDKVSHFWAFVIWNYDEKRIQILEITQKTLMMPIEALVKNPKWGSPKGYDITITRKGTGLNDTEYAVMPNPHTPVDPEIIAKAEKTPVNLEALFENLDPFTVDKD